MGGGFHTQQAVACLGEIVPLMKITPGLLVIYVCLEENITQDLGMEVLSCSLLETRGYDTIDISTFILKINWFFTLTSNAPVQKVFSIKMPRTMQFNQSKSFANARGGAIPSSCGSPPTPTSCCF